MALLDGLPAGVTNGYSVAGSWDADGRLGDANGGVFSADAEIGRDLAAVDWTATGLGAPETWPQSLQTAVSILLSSRFSMWMAWGPQLTFFCNAAYRRDTLGSKYPWALGRPAREVWAEIWDDIGPRIGSVLSTGKATWDQGLLLFLERSGYPEETYHTFSYSPLRDDSGQRVGMLCVVSEDTNRVIGERRMATLRDLGSDPSVVRNEQEVLAFAGDQLGRNRRDLPFTLTYLFDGARARPGAATGIAPDHPAAGAVVLADPHGLWPVAALARGESALVDLGDPRFGDLPAGQWPEPPEQALLVPLVQQGGPPSGFFVAGLNRYRPLDDGYRAFVELVAGHIAADISSARSFQAQQRRAEELAELDRAKTAFFSNISHEFRTPLALIMGPVQELRRALADSEKPVSEDLEVIHRNGLRLGKLVNTLLDFSRIEAGRMQARFEPLDLAAATAELASVFRSAMEKAGLHFDIDCPPLREPVYVDRNLWEKVVLNLLSNALKFTFEGSVGVTVRADGADAVVVVSDTGTGIAAEEMPRLFERFHRIENARSRSNEGSGIGLALVQELVRLHGGTITAESAEGKGTQFTIRIPFGHAHLPAGTTVAAGEPALPTAIAEPYVSEALRWLPGESAAAANAQALDLSPARPASIPDGTAPVATVLIADDNADMREYLARLLSGAGYRVTAVADGQEALDASHAEPPDLIVSDVMMPRLDGLSLVSALRADVRTAVVPVLLLSARAGQEASIEGLRAGADDYLVKPFAAAEFLARVRANVELARLRSRQARWRSALVDSMHEAFFVCDTEGTVTEINSAFTDILGYGTDGLPYRPVHPWLPDAESDPEAHQQAAVAFATLLSSPEGGYTIPVNHRDGHRVWVKAAFSRVQDPGNGDSVIVGTFRDVTAEHYAIQREAALGALSMRLSQAPDLTGALVGALEELHRMWHARQSLAVLFTPDDHEVLTCLRATPGGDAGTAPGAAPGGDAGAAPGADAGTAGAGTFAFEDLPERHRAAVLSLRDSSRPATAAVAGLGVGVALDHPKGTLVLWLDLGPGRPVTSEDRLLMALLSAHLGQGLARVHQIDQQRETAIALQRAILGPAKLPQGFAVRYEPAAKPLEVGGDWYDTITLPDGRIGIVVGDCVGRGLSAASAMGQLRSACRALLLRDPSPARMLTTMDDFAAGIPGAVCTTVFCGVLDPVTGRLVYASAGHPPGVLAHPDGTIELLSAGRSLPLVVRPGAQRSEAGHTIPARATMLLYTDGLVERRERSITDSIGLAARAVHDAGDVPVEDAVSQVVTRMRFDGFDDDVAVLLYRHPAALDLTFPAEPDQLADVRDAIRTWLRRCDIPHRIAQDVLVAAGEACANAIEHGHHLTPGRPIRLRAEAYASRLNLTVTDTGTWRTPQANPGVHRGHGVKLMNAMMQNVAITSGPAGTTVDMSMRIEL